MIRSLLAPQTYVVCVEHDLSILDYLSDYICCLYGQPGGYGVVTMPMSVRQGINVFLAGWIPSENMRFREYALNFRASDNVNENVIIELSEAAKDNLMVYNYPSMTKTLGVFKLTVQGGAFKPSEVIMMLGQNGTGKTTLIKMLAGILKPDGDETEMPEMSISYKPQTIAPKF